MHLYFIPKARFTVSMAVLNDLCMELKKYRVVPLSHIQFSEKILEKFKPKTQTPGSVLPHNC
jgi:hypothetical protein